MGQEKKCKWEFDSLLTSQKFSSTFHNSACFPPVFHWGHLNIHLSALTGLTMKKECIHTVLSNRILVLNLSICSHTLQWFGSLPFISGKVKIFPVLVPSFSKKATLEINQYNPPCLQVLGLIFLSSPSTKEREKNLKALLMVPFFIPFHAPPSNRWAAQLGYCPLCLNYSPLLPSEKTAES